MRYLVFIATLFLCWQQCAFAQQSNVDNSAFQEASALFQSKSWVKAREALEPLANAGDARAQSMMGDLYYYGFGVTQSHETSFYWTQKAAEQGRMNSIANLAEFYEKGIGGVEQDLPRAISLLERAAGEGSQYAKDELIRIRGELPDTEAPSGISAKGEQKLVEAKLGNGAALKSLGYYHMLGNEGFPQNGELAIAYFAAAVSRGTHDAALGMGQTYYNGYGGISVDMLEAGKWYIYAAENGHPEGLEKVGWWHAIQYENLYDNLARAQYYFMLAEQFGHKIPDYKWRRLNDEIDELVSAEVARERARLEAERAERNRRDFKAYRDGLRALSAPCRNPRKAIVSRNGKLAREETVCD